MIGIRQNPYRVGTNGGLTMSVMSHKKQLSLADVAKHAEVAVVGETLEIITGGLEVKKPEPRIVVLVEDLLKRLLDTKI
jgi:hypothetical protein